MKSNPHPLLRSWILLTYISAVLCGPLRAGDEIENAFRDALYAEEVKGDTEAALKAYQEVAAKFEQQRDMAATALFRQGECLRKLGRKDEAAAMYRKVLAQYSDRERLAKQSRENLTALGRPATDAAPAPGLFGGMTEAEAKEIARLRVLAENSPDLLNHENPAPLEKAAEAGHAAVVAWILKQMPESPKGHLSVALRRGSQEGHLKVCEQLLDAGADVNGAENAAPIMVAVNSNRFAVVRLLLERKADVNVRGGIKPPNNPFRDKAFGLVREADGKEATAPYAYAATPLMAAATADVAPAEIVAALLKAGADVNAAGKVARHKPEARQAASSIVEELYPITALGLAVLARNPDKVKLLLAAGAKPNQVCGDLGSTALHLALINTALVTAEGKPDTIGDAIVRQLLDAGADWKVSLSSGATALHFCAKRSLSHWLTEGIKSGVDVNAAFTSGLTALHLAAQAQSLDCIRALLAAGAGVNALTTAPGWELTPLGYASMGAKRNAESLDAVKALLDAGADPNAGGAIGTRPLDMALLNGWWIDSWPEAVKLLVERGARPKDSRALHADRFNQSASTNASNTLNDAVREAFRETWKAAHWRDNPRLAHAVWISQGESMLEAKKEPLFRAVLCDDAACGPPALRQFIAMAYPTDPDWSRVTIIRQKDGKEEIIPVDVAALAASPDAKEIPLQWGDVVEFPLHASKQDSERQFSVVSPWASKDIHMDVRVTLGDGRMVANATNDAGPVFRLDWQRAFKTSDVLRTAGVPEFLSAGITILGTGVDGTLEPRTENDATWIRHGDTLQLRAPAAVARLNDDAQRSGVWLCQSMDGPFWKVPVQQLVGSPSGPAPLAGLMVALLAPHPLLSPCIDWEKAMVRFLEAPPSEQAADPFGVPTNSPRVWQEKKLLDAWPGLQISPGTILILPPAERDSFEPSAELRAALTKALAVNWKLRIGVQPEVDGHFEPRFFRGEKKDGTWLWRDLDPKKADGPLLPVIGQLLETHPRAADFAQGPKDFLTAEFAGLQPQDILNRDLWLSGDRLIVSVKEPSKPQNPPPTVGPQQGVRRRVTLPTSGNN